MKGREWMITGICALAAAAVGYGATQATVGSVKEDVHDLKLWKDKAIEQMGSMDGKLDALLLADGVVYKPIRRGR